MDKEVKSNELVSILKDDSPNNESSSKILKKK